MSIFDFSDYKRYLIRRNKALPGGGRGELTRIAHRLDIHTTMVTHVLKGASHFSLEQTLKLADYLALNELETDYLVALVQWERAGDKRSKDFCAAKVSEIRHRALDLKTRLGTTNELSEADRAFYYSSWRYSYIRLLTAISRYQNPEALAEESGLSLAKVREALEFLVSKGLCRDEGAKITYGEVSTYVESKSPLVVRHHKNWREKTQEAFDHLRTEDLVFTYPVVMSATDFLKVRDEIVKFIETFKGIAGPSPSENLYCFNIDWLKLSK